MKMDIFALSFFYFLCKLSFIIVPNGVLIYSLSGCKQLICFKLRKRPYFRVWLVSFSALVFFKSILGNAP